jgi:hypothetical protein
VVFFFQWSDCWLDFWPELLLVDAGWIILCASGWFFRDAWIFLVDFSWSFSFSEVIVGWILTWVVAGGRWMPGFFLVDFSVDCRFWE